MSRFSETATIRPVRPSTHEQKCSVGVCDWSKGKFLCIFGCHAIAASRSFGFASRAEGRSPTVCNGFLATCVAPFRHRSETTKRPSRRKQKIKSICICKIAAFFSNKRQLTFIFLDHILLCSNTLYKTSTF